MLGLNETYTLTYMGDAPIRILNTIMNYMDTISIRKLDLPMYLGAIPADQSDDFIYDKVALARRTVKKIKVR